MMMPSRISSTTEGTRPRDCSARIGARTAAVAMKTNDFTDGQLVNAVLYGTSHTFLMSKSQLVDQPQLAGAYPGIRWE